MNTGRSPEQQAALKRLFKDMAVIDAEHDMRVAVLPEDTEGATRADPANCALARACKRQFGTTDALFFRNVAYVAIPDETGVKRVERFMITPAAFELLANFDLHGVAPSGGAFVMRAPSASKRLDRQKDRYHAYRKAVLAGERKVDAVRSQQQKDAMENRRVLVAQHSLRDGTGMVHFTAHGDEPDAA